MFARINSFIKSTRFKTIIWFSLVFLILEFVLGSVIYIYLLNKLNSQLDASLIKQCDHIYHFLGDNNIDPYNFTPDSIYASPDELVYDLAFEAIALNPNNTFIQVMYKDKIIFQTENLKSFTTHLAENTDQEQFLKTFSDKQLSVHDIRAAVLNKNDYQIITAFPLVLINESLDSLADLYVIIAPLFLLVSIIGGTFISFKSLSRIDRIINRTKFITTQNLDDKIEGDEYDDEYGRLAKTMNEMIIRIKKSIEYMNQFSISAAHELKTPLTILRGEIELALRSDCSPQEYRLVLQSNLDETLRLIKIVDKLFYISKTDHALVKLNKQRTELSTFILSSIESMKKIASEKNMSLIFECENEIYDEIDKGLMDQVMYNLIENAIKFGDPGTAVKIKLSRLENNKTYISVTNKGEQIPPELLDKIYERFFRLESSRNRNTGGVGLGLSIVKSFVEMHGGTTEVKSNNDGITTFAIII